MVGVVNNVLQSKPNVFVSSHYCGLGPVSPIHIVLKHPYAVWVRNVVASTLQNLYMLPIRVSGVYSVFVGVGPVDLVRAEVDGDPVRPVNSVSRDDRLIVCAVHPGSYNSGVTG